VANFGVIGFYSFEDEERIAVSVTPARCIEMLRNFLTSELSRHGIELTTIWFQQDGATARTASVSIEVIREIFPEHVILLRGEFPWPTPSPDLCACA
jgi:hypothetical protein